MTVRSASLALLVVAAFVGGVTACSSCATPRPKGEAGSRADDVARAVELKSGKAAWEQINVVAFTFRDMRSFVWDKKNQQVQVIKEDLEVLLDLSQTKPQGIATKKGIRVPPADEAALVDETYSWFINDSFWLNPLVKLFDTGTTRELVKIEEGTGAGSEGLLVRYESGGVTPGDAYLWILGDDGLPQAWRLWVQVMPIPGAEMSWEGWIDVAGAKIATVHKAFGQVAVSINDVKAGATVSEVTGKPDPFMPLAARRASSPAPSSSPPSMSAPSSAPAPEPAPPAESVVPSSQPTAP